jgi:isopenicillin N synthase-like dioxygenase
MQAAIVDYQAPDAPQKFAESLHQTGFAVLKNHPISPELFQQVTEDWSQFFASDEKSKFMYDREAFPQDGYFPTESAKGEVVNDLKEFYQIYPNGRMPESVSESSWQLFRSSYEIGVNVLKWLDENMPQDIHQKLSCHLQEMADPDVQTMLRIIHYPPQSGDEQSGALRAAEHEDINLITILPAADEPGLEAQDRQGNWHEVPCDPGMIVINAGDPLQMSTEGYYKSTTHRVRNPSKARMHLPRYSFPLFLHCKADIVLDTKTGFTAGEYLRERLVELGLA